jgi:hypothetical protein
MRVTIKRDIRKNAPRASRQEISPNWHVLPEFAFFLWYDSIQRIKIENSGYSVNYSAPLGDWELESVVSSPSDSHGTFKIPRVGLVFNIRSNLIL